MLHIHPMCLMKINHIVLSIAAILIQVIREDFELYGQNNIVPSYSSKDTLVIETNLYKLIHQYDLTDATRENRWNMISTNENPFIDKNNNYSRVIFINLATKDTIFNIPSVALTYIQIDTINQLIIGLSDIMYWNPYNMIIVNFHGEVIAKRRFSVMEAKLCKIDYEKFKKNFYEIYAELKVKDRIYLDSGQYYIDFLGMNLTQKDSSAYKYLAKRTIFNHLCPSITSGKRRFYDCYDNSNPFKELLLEDGIPVLLILYGCENKLMTISLRKVED